MCYHYDMRANFMKNIKFRIIIYNEQEGSVDFIFIDKLNILDRIKLGCLKIRPNKNTYFIRTETKEEFLECLRNTIPCKESENSDYDFYCAVVEPRKYTPTIINFNSLISLVIRDYDFSSFDERNDFVSECNKIKAEQIRKIENDGDDFVEQYNNLCM